MKSKKVKSKIYKYEQEKSSSSFQWWIGHQLQRDVSDQGVRL
jgi:hypothetical protein